jgi:hypothetical protein
MAMKFAGLGPLSFHVVNAMEAQLTVQTFNQDDVAKTIPFETYNVGSRKAATCRARPGAGQGPKAIACKLNGDSKVLYIPDGARLKAVKVSSSLPRSPLPPCPSLSLPPWMPPCCAFSLRSASTLTCLWFYVHCLKAVAL